jgi:hypothetical protein
LVGAVVGSSGVAAGLVSSSAGSPTPDDAPGSPTPDDADGAATGGVAVEVDGEVQAAVATAAQPAIASMTSLVC